MNIKCVDCGGTMKAVVLDQLEQRSKKRGLVIFEDVPAEECPRCGQRYFSPTVTKAMDLVLEGAVPPSGETKVPTFTLKHTAA